MTKTTTPVGNELQRAKDWFALAVPTPTDKTRMVQAGVHFEEIAEMFTAIGAPELAEPLDQLATGFKTGLVGNDAINFTDLTVNREKLLDALCDQIVTAVGFAYMLNMDIVTAMNRVNDSNWSKFGPDLKPQFDANGKIKKSVDYVPPNLTGLY